ncbi:MAG: protein phosphatase CheZ [Rhodoferax sp.]|nr:protein phosphatase CheZ [Rhodoferax sp.]
MRIEELPVANAAASPEVFQRLGEITRQLHDTLTQLGVMPKLRQSAQGLPDARSRLSYVARKSGEAADKVLTCVEHAKREQTELAGAARSMVAALSADARSSAAGLAAIGLVAQLEASTDRIDAHLTDIMLAQDFHDLTGQVVAKVVTLAMDLEDSLVGLLVQAAPGDSADTQDTSLRGPAMDSTAGSDVAANQSEVDDLLASFGF